MNAEVVAALVDVDLDHLVGVSAGVEKPTVGSYLDQVMNKSGSQTFDAAADSLEAIRDRGDADWSTGTAANPNILEDGRDRDDEQSDAVHADRRS